MRPFLTLLYICVCTCGFSQKNIVASRSTGRIVVDGKLDDAAWVAAPQATDFIKNYPSFGEPSSQRTLTRILYDDDAIYVSAHLYDDPAKVRRQLTARDGFQRQDVDYFGVMFDTYLDRQNGFQYIVTAANVQGDAKLTPPGDNGTQDESWDAVWESRVSTVTDGWVVEMKIPYLSLRFGKREVQNWGVQFTRHIRRENETSFWNPTDPKVQGLVNQFGQLNGLANLQPPLRLSFSPYLSTGIRNAPDADGNGFNSEWLKSGGADVKWGVNESFTVDATLIPDFGQVISDNVVNNLSPFEVQFQENRPFFTEGTELFNKAGLFYSRRVGDMPRGYYDVYGTLNSDEEVTKNPGLTRLYNAIKFSGRTQDRLGIGVFNAVAAPMRATVRNNATGDERKYETAPLTNYNIIVLDQAFKDRSSITLTNTSVVRNGAGRDATVTALNFAKFDKKSVYNLNGAFAYSNVRGSDPHKGYAANLNFQKVSGRFQFQQYAGVESDRYDPNDLGYLRAPNEVALFTGLRYNQFQPTKNFQSWFLRFNNELNYLYKPNVFTEWEMSANATLVFKNFWDVTLGIGGQPRAEEDYFELRKRDSMLKRFPYYFVFLEGSTDSRKKLFLSYELVFANGTLKEDNYYNIELEPRFRFSNKFTATVGMSMEYDNLQLGYALRNGGGSSVVGFRKNTTVSPLVSAIYNFTPRMNVTLRSRHYWNKVNYRSFHTTDRKGELVYHPFVPGQDDNFNAFNTDVFFTWDFRLGSRIVAGWKNWLGDDMIDGSKHNTFGRNVGQIFRARHGNELTLRVIYFIDYNALRKKRGAVNTGNNG